jgi:hypothetical protein
MNKSAAAQKILLTWCIAFNRMRDTARMNVFSNTTPRSLVETFSQRLLPHLRTSSARVKYSNASLLFPNVVDWKPHIIQALMSQREQIYDYSEPKIIPNGRGQCRTNLIPSLLLETLNRFLLDNIGAAFVPSSMHLSFKDD